MSFVVCLFLFFLFLRLTVSLPTQIHVAFAGTDSSGLSFMWFTPSSEDSIVFMSRFSDLSVVQSFRGSENNYAQKGFHHTVLTGTLEFGTLYFYKVGNGVLFSSVYNVTTALEPAVEKPFTVAVLGDMGITNSGATFNLLEANLPKYDFVFHIGDISYADDHLEAYESTWDVYMNHIGNKISSAKPYMVLPGNHEATCTEVIPFFCPDVTRNFTAYRNRFRMPFEESGAVNNMWYSFDYGIAHFISLDSETDYDSAPENPGTYLNAGPFGDQIAWIKADLAKAAANRAKIPWIIVGAHRPIYSTGGFTRSWRELLEPLFIEFGVDFYFCGHVHWYERLYNVKNDQLTGKSYSNPTSPVYIINGAAGNIEGHTSGGTDMDYLAYRNNADYGYGHLTVFNSSLAQWSFFKAQDGSIVDQIYVYRENHTPY